MAKDKYEEKKKNLAAKGMPNPKVKHNVSESDKESEMGPKCKHCGSKKHKSHEHKK